MVYYHSETDIIECIFKKNFFMLSFGAQINIQLLSLFELIF